MRCDAQEGYLLLAKLQAWLASLQAVCLVKKYVEINRKV